MLNYQKFAQSKTRLLITVIIAVVSAVSLPVLLPHIYHGNHIYHLLLHTAGIILSVFLAILSVNSYYRLRTKKMMITTIAFLIFSAAEIVQLINATETHVYYFFESPQEIAHLMMLGMIGLFAIAIFRKD